MLAESVAELRTEAQLTNERRLLVLTGTAERTAAAAKEALEAASIAPPQRTLITNRAICAGEQLAPEAVTELLGRTRTVVLIDCHTTARPNVFGAAIGAVRGGGLVVLLTPPFPDWPSQIDDSVAAFAAPPYEPASVGGRFRSRLIETLSVHPGIAIWDADGQQLRRDGLVDPAPRLKSAQVQPPTQPGGRFPGEAYDACRTQDQSAALATLEGLLAGHSAVVTANRGRGKSSVAGLAAGALAEAGQRVLVTGRPGSEPAELLTRARELLETLGVLEQPIDGRLEARGGGCVRAVAPATALECHARADILMIDEAAALPVATLETLAEGPPAVFVTTTHGYEGTGGGFRLKLRDQLDGLDREVLDIELDEPIRYAAGDPIEVWAFRALILNAGPAAPELIGDARPKRCTYERYAQAATASDEPLLRELVGLLSTAHYRTEPDDVARMLDAPNIRIRGLSHEGRVVAVALLAEEGGLSADTRRRSYEGERLAGNMIPDLLSTQLRDEQAGRPVGVRVLRIATHRAVRSSGLGSRLLEAIRDELRDSSGSTAAPDRSVDYLSVGYGATPRLVRFWRANGYRAIHLSTSRNERSGAHSAVMLSPLTAAGKSLHARSARFLVGRLPAVLGDALDEADPDVIRELLLATAATPALELSDREWRLVASAAFGPGLFSVSPRPFRALAMRALVDPAGPLARQEAVLLIRRVLQGWAAAAVASDLGYDSAGVVMRAVGAAYRPLVDAYGPKIARQEASRYR